MAQVVRPSGLLHKLLHREGQACVRIFNAVAIDTSSVDASRGTCKLGTADMRSPRRLASVIGVWPLYCADGLVWNWMMSSDWHEHKSPCCSHNPHTSPYRLYSQICIMVATLRFLHDEIRYFAALGSVPCPAGRNRYKIQEFGCVFTTGRLVVFF